MIVTYMAQYVSFYSAENAKGETKSIQIAKSLLAGQVRAVVLPWARAGRIRWQDHRGSPRVIESRIDEAAVIKYS